MSSFARPALIVVAFLALISGAATAATRHTNQADGIVKCKNPAECSVPR